MPFDTNDRPELLANEISLLRDPLIDAASFVGGSAGGRRAVSALDALVTRGPASRLACEKLWSLLGLLSLEEPDHPDAEISSIEPWDPRAEEIMLLTDRLRELLEALDASVIAPQAA